jgi:hypothetical protein
VSQVSSVLEQISWLMKWILTSFGDFKSKYEKTHNKELKFLLERPLRNVANVQIVNEFPQSTFKLIAFVAENERNSLRV